jgi:CRISPR system Cascade subunit CasA
VTTPADAHPLQAFWGMPRRIRLECIANPDAALCDLTGQPDTVVVSAWRQEGGGPEYTGWRHPLSAYRQGSPGGAWTAVRGSSDVGYEQWVGWVFGDVHHKNRRPAQMLVDWSARVTDLPDETRQRSRILAAGFVSDKGAVGDRIESEMPLPGFDRTTYAAAAYLVQRPVEATTLIGNALSYAAMQTVRARSFSTAGLVAACWRDTEHDFYRLLRGIQPGATHEQALNAVALEWLRCLRAVATRLFGDAFPIVPGAPNATHVAQQWRWLRDTFNGATPAGQRLFAALLLPLPKSPQE